MWQKVGGSTKSAQKMFLLRLLLASSAALFLTVGSQGPCVPANCSAAMGDLPPLCNCDENCTEFADDCCGPQHLHERGVAKGQATNRSLVCGNASSNVTLSCPAGLVLSEETGIMTSSIDTVVLAYNHQGYPLVVCIPRPIPLPPGIVIVSWVSYSLSILGGVFILLTHSLFKELRTLSGILLMNLSVAIIMLNFSLTVIYSLPVLTGIAFVVLLTFFVYFSCSEFAWMTLLLVKMTRSLYLAWKLTRPSEEGSKWRLILIYMLVGWGLPLLVAPIGAIPVRVNFSLGLAFLLMVLSLLCLVNLCLLVIATVFLCRFSRHRRRVGTHSYSDLIRLWVAFFAVTLPALAALTFLLSIIYTSLFAYIRIIYVHVILSNASLVVISFAFLCTKKVLKLYRDLFTCTSRNTRPAANPVLPVRSPDEGCGPPPPKKAHIKADVDMPNIREGKTPTPTGDGETPAGEGETPTGEGETPTGEGETPTGEGETSTGEGETPTGEGETPTGEGETSTGEGETPTGEGETPTGEGETLTGEGETPTGEGETPTEEGETPTGDGETLTGEGETPAGEGETPTGEGETSTGEGETPTGEGETPAGDGETPTGEGETPTGEGETSTGDGETPTGEGETSTGEGETSTGEGETPTGEGETPTGEGETSTGEGETPTGEGETPTGEGETPTGEGETSTGEGETSTGEGETPTGEGETSTGEGETLTGEGETPTGDPIREGETLTGEGETLMGDGETLTGDGVIFTREGETLTGEGEIPIRVGEALMGEGDTPTGEGEKKKLNSQNFIEN